MRGALAACGALVALAWTSPAGAYVLLRASTGEPAHWESICVPWYLGERGSDDLALDVVESTLDTSFATWSEVPTAYPVFRREGLTCFSTVRIASWPGPQNIVVFRDDTDSWTHPSKVVGLTTVSMDDETGEIVDADIELNGERFAFAVDGAPLAYDLAQVVTHEAGHVLGLDHSDVPDAVMTDTSKPGDRTRLTLRSDDVAGLNESHPAASAPAGTGCPAAPAAADARFCPPRPDDGCVAAPGGAAAAWWLAWGLLLAGALARTRRGRRT